MNAKSIILRFRKRFRKVVCSTERQIETMLLTLISEGGEELENLKRFQSSLQRAVGRTGWREAVRHYCTAL